MPRRCCARRVKGALVEGTNARYRSHRPEPALHVHRHGDADRHLRRRRLRCKTPTDIFPNIGIPVVAVVWTYNGLPPDDMSGRVIYYYERTLSAQVNDIEHIESQSLAGYGVVKVFFQPNVNINSALAQITAASQTVLKLLPPGITPPYVLSFNASSVPILQLALSSKALSQAQIFDAGQNFIRPQLATVAGAAIPSPYGGKVLQVQVDLDQDKLQAYGLSSQDVVDAIAQQNVITPVGTEKVGQFEYVVALNDAPSRIAELNDLPIRDVNGVTGLHPRRRLRSRGQSAADQYGARRRCERRPDDDPEGGSASTLDVIAGVKALLPKLRETLPASLRLDAVGDQSTFVKAAVSSVIFEGVVAAALTGLMILIFLGSWRSTLIITISIPLAILTSVTLLAATGETINVMTLGGLALAVGILVDDATVTIENINYHLEQGKDIESAIMDGARQIVIPATVSLLCICIVFVPMFTLGGRGRLFVPPDGEGGRLRADRLVRALAHAGEHDGALPARPSGGAWPWRAGAADPQSFHALPARIRPAVRGGARLLPARARHRPGRDGAFHRRLHGGRPLLVCARALSRTQLFSADRKHANRSCTCARRRGCGSKRPRCWSIRSKRRSGRSFRRRPCARLSTISDCRSAASIWPTPIRARSGPPTLTF